VHSNPREDCVAAPWPLTHGLVHSNPCEDCVARQASLPRLLKSTHIRLHGSTMATDALALQSRNCALAAAGSRSACIDGVSLSDIFERESEKEKKEWGLAASPLL